MSYSTLTLSLTKFDLGILYRYKNLYGFNRPPEGALLFDDVTNIPVTRSDSKKKTAKKKKENGNQHKNNRCSEYTPNIYKDNDPKI